MRYDDPRLGEELVSEIINGDAYQLRRIRDRGVRQVLDLGANCGTFSMACRVYWPDARIDAVEANPETYELLKQNMGAFKVNTHLLGIGDGSLIRPRMGHLAVGGIWENSGSVVVDSDTEGEGGVPSFGLVQLCEHLGISIQRDTLVKIDIEGAERFIITDHPSLTILTNALAWSVEVHLRPMLPMLPSSDEVSAWANSLAQQLKRSHRVYHRKSTYNHCVSFLTL